MLALIVRARVGDCVVPCVSSTKRDSVARRGRQKEKVQHAMWHAVIAHATHLRDAFPRAEIAGSRRGTLILACAMHSTVEVRQQLQPRRPPYPPLRRQLQPRQPPYPPPIHLLVARDHSLGVQMRKQTDDSQGTPRTIGRGQRTNVVVSTLA